MLSQSCRSIIIVLSLAANLPCVHSQIFGCDDVDCPKPDVVSGPVACTFPKDGLGITSFDSNLTTEGPLTWTMRGDHSDRQGGSGKIWRTYLKTFHLGTPPSLDLGSGSYRGCAFLLSNVTTALQVSDGYDDWSKFGCDTALGKGCTEDLISQGRDQLQHTLSLSSSMSQLSTCAEIRDAVQGANMPGSCKVPGGRKSWGRIADKIIAGHGAFVPLAETQDDCCITTGGPLYKESFEMWDSVELTVPDDSGYAGDTDFVHLEPEVHMTCLRAIPIKETGGSAALTIRLSKTAVLGILLLVAGQMIQ